MSLTRSLPVRRAISSNSASLSAGSRVSIAGEERKAAEKGSIIVTDNLNTALGKLEKKVDDALPLAGGIVTGDLEVQGTLTADASSAKKLSVADTGSENAFVYIKDGVPVASPYTR